MADAARGGSWNSPSPSILGGCSPPRTPGPFHVKHLGS
jgi:hypothetical protein